MSEEQNNLSKDEKKKLADYLYKEEEQRWKNVTEAYYKPRGAPGRLSEELLDQWHTKNSTGVVHPTERRQFCVQVMFDERSYTIKRFLSEKAALKYCDTLGGYKVDAEIVAHGEQKFLNSVLGEF